MVIYSVTENPFRNLSQTHCPQVDGDKRCIRNQVSIGAKKSTREIESFLDISTDGSLLEATAHRFCNAHEPVCEERQQDGIWLLWFAHGCGCTRAEEIVEVITLSSASMMISCAPSSHDRNTSLALMLPT